MSAYIITAIAVLLVGVLVFVGWRLRLTARLYWRKALLLAIGLAVATTAGLLPVPRANTGEVVTNTDFVFLVDTTYSMNALDGRVRGSSRLADARSDIETLATRLAGSRFGIITYDDISTIYLPLTTTTSDIRSSAVSIQTKDYLWATSNPSFAGAFTDTRKYLDEAAKADVTRQRVLVLMTDGELQGDKDTVENVRSAARQLGGSIDAAVVVGYGSNSGARIPQLFTDLDDSFEQKPTTGGAQVFGSDGRPVVTKRDEALLKELAGDLRGAYVAEINSGDLYNAVTAARQNAALQKANSPENRALAQNISHIPLAVLLLVLLVLLELVEWRPLVALVANWRRS